MTGVQTCALPIWFFKQSITASRIQGQDNPSEEANPESLFSSDKIADINKGFGISNSVTKAIESSITPDFTTKIQSTIDNTTSALDKVIPKITGVK